MFKSIVFLFLGSAMSQSCMNLDANSPCGPDFAGAPVPFASMAEFTENYVVFADVSQAVEAINSNPTVSCNITNDDALKQQYQISYFCALIVDDAINKNNCQPTAPFEPVKAKLCPEACKAAENSVSKSVAACGNPKSGSECSRVSSSEANCFSGIKAEADLCGFRTKEAADIGCPTIREDEKDAECCKSLIPGVVLLPAESKAIPMTIAIGAAAGVAAFLIIIAMVASCIWFSAPTKKRQSSIKGNFMPKNRRSSSSTASTLESENTYTTYATPRDVELKKPAQVEQKILPFSKIGMQNPYIAPNKIAPKTEPNQVTAFNRDSEDVGTFNRDSEDVGTFNRDSVDLGTFNRDSVDLGTYNSNRKTIDLDVLDLSIPVEQVPPKPEEYASNPPMEYRPSNYGNGGSELYKRALMAQSVYSNFQDHRNEMDSTLLVEESSTKPEEYASNPSMEYESDNASYRDSGFYTRPNPAQSMYSNLLRDQYSEAESNRGSMMEEKSPYRNMDSVYSMSTDQFAVDDMRQSFQLNDELRDSLLSFQFPSPPSRPPIHEKK